MAAMDDKVLARRQKDLDDYTDDYAMRLEVMTAKHTRDMAKTWKGMSTRLEGKIKAMYVEAGAIQDPRKLKTMGNKIKRLEALQSQLEEDLKLSNAQLQPYFTGILKNQFEDTYYHTAFGLEQAAKVAVVVPMLTPAMVLGVLANPWVGNGANYAQRLNVNMANLAASVRDSVATAVSDGLGWNQTAHLIKEKTGESYYNAVRLARTELTRASAQGASYSYMENADILDGKRWNATKDSRTAPKDAKNDGQQYDLDYDTTENPGVAGQRIPNHPHCRCLWSPVLSALGVQDKERIARDDSDTPKSWGDNYYTKAATYRDYAKERGLPDLDARLKTDNPSKYLRPGETMIDLTKKVQRWTYKGATIAVAKPDWDAVKAAPSTAIPTAANEIAATTWADRVKARIAKGVTTEADVREVGGMVRQQILSFNGETYKEIQKLDAEGQGILDMLNETQIEGPEYDKHIAKYHEISDKRYSLSATLNGEKRDIVKGVLKDIRPIGPKDANSAQQWVKKSVGKVKTTINDVREYLPTDWVEKSNLQPMIAKNTTRGYYREADLKDYAAKGYTLDQVKAWGMESRLTGTISLSGDYGKHMLECGFHEMGHRMEDLIPDIRKLENEFYARRTQGESLQWLGGSYAKSEKTRKDNFISKYIGKDYGNKADSYYEVLSMGLESVFTNSYKIANDEDYYDFILGLIAAV
jgi:SPP1 gp7 family putative phage head morphogenesis protein